MIQISKLLRRFRRDQDGSLSVEFMFMVPILIWLLIAPLQYFDAYRAEAKSNKAALTLADMYSRETGYIDPNYLNGSHALLKSLTLTESNPSFRVTVFMWNDKKKKYIVRWSRRRGNSFKANLKTSTIADLASRLPVLSHGERAILLETRTDYVPKYGNGFGIMDNTGLEGIPMATFVVLKPRFAPTVCWNATPHNPSKERC